MLATSRALSLALFSDSRALLAALAIGAPQPSGAAAPGPDPLHPPAGFHLLARAFGALSAGSWRAREWLGWNAGLDEGAPADLVVYDRDPLTDLSVLLAPARVVLRGVVVA